MSELALLSDVLVKSAPLILTGLSVAFAFRAGILNIGAEGQLLMGAAAAAAVALNGAHAGRWVIIPLALFAGALGGAGWAAIAAELRSRFQVLEVISTIMLNFVAVYVVSFLVRGPLQEPSGVYPQTATIPDASQLPLLVPGTRLHFGVLLAAIIASLLWWILAHSSWGFRVRAVGAGGLAAASAARIDIGRTARNAFLLSGALAGLAGAVELTGVTFALYENLSPGYGYTGIAVALLARLNPAFVVPVGIFFGALHSGAGALQRDAGIPMTMVAMIEAAIILAVIAAERRFAGWRLPSRISAAPEPENP